MAKLKVGKIETEFLSSKSEKVEIVVSREKSGGCNYFIRVDNKTLKTGHSKRYSPEHYLLEIVRMNNYTPFWDSRRFKNTYYPNDDITIIIGSDPKHKDFEVVAIDNKDNTEVFHKRYPIEIQEEGALYAAIEALGIDVSAYNFNRHNKYTPERP